MTVKFGMGLRDQVELSQFTDEETETQESKMMFYPNEKLEIQASYTVVRGFFVLFCSTPLLL
jgi:hypothetical protein